MNSTKDTIFALSSGNLPSGVAVIRLSGDRCSYVADAFDLKNLRPRTASIRDIKIPGTNEILDRGLCLFFSAPNSFTGEDCLELHVHGGKAVVSKILDVLSGFDSCRLADAGEFSRRAFENGKLDLTEIEGLGDLISAETEQQRKQAVSQAGGRFRGVLENWRAELIRCRAFLEVEFDFSDEDDVPDSMYDIVATKIGYLINEISGHLNDSNRGEIIREGFAVVLAGAPNSGKSSLLNALAGRDIAIVSSRAGTTRDVLACKIDIEGIPVIFYDTAGIRETADDIELEGIRRALDRASNADLTIWLSSSDNPVEPSLKLNEAAVFTSKSDIVGSVGAFCINTIDKDGLKPLISFLKDTLKSRADFEEPILITRHRHRVELTACLASLVNASGMLISNTVLASEELRLASLNLGRLTGFIDVEDLLDVIFSEFCIGK